MDASQLLIIIPARGGSKGLPGKNAKILGNFPLLKWTSDAVNLSGLENVQCILSTDDKDIADIGTNIGLHVPFIRPAELGSDTATAVDVINHAVNWFKHEQNFQSKYIMLLQPTSPFRSPEVIRKAFQMISRETTDKPISAVIGTKPIHRALGTLFYSDKYNQLSALEEQSDLRTRRQDVRPLYTPNGAMYAIKNDVLKEQNTLFPKHSHCIPMDQIQSHDIDDAIDWAMATSYVNANLSWRSNES